MTLHGANAAAAGGGLPDPSHRPSSAATPHSLTPEERRVFELIPHGRANAVKQRRLAAQCRMSTRSLQRVLKDLTELRGLPVASSCSHPMGVFVPDTQTEVDEFIRQLKARALSCFRRISALNKAAAAELVREQQQMEIGFPAPPLRVGEPICEHCENSFTRKRTTQTYCCPGCRLAAARKRGTI